MIIAIEITSKRTGLLLFHYEFIPSVIDDVMKDLRAGALSAIMNVMDETFGSQQSKVVKYGRFEVIITENFHTYGLLYTFEADEFQDNYLTETLNGFEKKFETELNSIDVDFIVDQLDYTSEVLRGYNALLQVDVSRLSKIMELVPSQEAFTDSVIFSRPQLSRIFTNIDDNKYFGYSNEIIKLFREFISIEHRTPFAIDELQVKLTRNIYGLLFNLPPYAILVFTKQENLEEAKKAIAEIRVTFDEIFSSKNEEESK